MHSRPSEVSGAGDFGSNENHSGCCSNWPVLYDPLWIVVRGGTREKIEDVHVSLEYLLRQINRCQDRPSSDNVMIIGKVNPNHFRSQTLLLILIIYVQEDGPNIDVTKMVHQLPSHFEWNDCADVITRAVAPTVHMVLDPPQIRGFCLWAGTAAV